jgi:hypothetical protein
MAWTAPMTAVAGSTFTAAQFNANVRDNLNQTAPALATTAGQYFVATGANAIAARSVGHATVATSETSTSTSYADVATVGPTVTVTTGTAALVLLKCAFDNATANVGTFMGFAVSGASSVAAADANAINIAGLAAASRARIGGAFWVTGLTAGSNIFTAKYKVASASTGTFTQRDMTVMGF